MRVHHKATIAVGAVLVSAVMIGLPALAQPSPNQRPVIVVFSDSVADAASVANEHAVANGFLPSHKFGFALKGYAASLNGRQLAAVSRDPRVAFVSEDRDVQIAVKPSKPVPPPPLPQVVPTGISRIGASAAGNVGAGVGVAIIDTGIDLTHPDLAANIVAGRNCLNVRKSAKDDNGHGTHVAGTVAALDNSQGVVGVAPMAKLLAVKVLNSSGSGTWSSIICGLDWVAANAVQYNVKVANMSLSGVGMSDNNCGATNGDALHAAICRVRDAGVTVVAAAGNEAADAAYSVPAAYDDAVITVSALADSDGLANGLGTATYYGADDTFASFSNYGAPVDLGAPGVSILSTVPGGGYSDSYSGTSMAAPHVAGAAALYHAANPGAAWGDVLSALVAGGEVLGAGHTDPTVLHPEPVLNVSGL